MRHLFKFRKRRTTLPQHPVTLEKPVNIAPRMPGESRSREESQKPRMIPVHRAGTSSF